MPPTVRNLGGRSSGGLAVATGLLGGVSRAASDLGTFFDKKEERKRRKPLEDLQLKHTLLQTEGLERKAGEEKKAGVRRDDIFNKIKELYPNASNEEASEIADKADQLPVDNETVLAAFTDPDTVRKANDPEEAQNALDEMGALEESENGEGVRAGMTQGGRDTLDLIRSEAQKPIDDLGVPSVGEIEEGGVLQPGQRAAEAPTTSTFRPDTTGELEKVELEPEDVRKAREIIQFATERGGFDDPKLTKTLASFQKIIDDFESGKASIAAGEEKERIRIEEAGVAEKVFKSGVEQKGLDRAAKKEEARLKREFERGQNVLKASAAKELASTKAEHEKANPKLSPAASEALTTNGFALVKLQKLKSLLLSDDVKVFEKGLPFIGGFTNPELNDVMTNLKNTLGRKDSGAAINEKEWKVFEKLILDTKDLVTEDGKKVALSKVDDIIGRFFTHGEGLSKGNQDWFNKYKKSAARGVEQVTKVPTKKTAIMTDADGNTAEVEVDENGNATKVIREL